MNRLLKRVAQYVAWFVIMISGVACVVVPLIYGFSYGEWWGLPFLIVGAPPLIFFTFKLGAKWDIDLPELG